MLVLATICHFVKYSSSSGGSKMVSVVSMETPFASTWAIFTQVHVGMETPRNVCMYVCISMQD